MISYVMNADSGRYADRDRRMFGAHLHGVVGWRRERDDGPVVVLVGDVDGNVGGGRHGRVARVDGQCRQVEDGRALAVQHRRRRDPPAGLVDGEARLRHGGRARVRQRRRRHRLTSTTPGLYLTGGVGG